MFFWWLISRDGVTQKPIRKTSKKICGTNELSKVGPENDPHFIGWWLNHPSEKQLSKWESSPKGWTYYQMFETTIGFWWKAPATSVPPHKKKNLKSSHYFLPIYSFSKEYLLIERIAYSSMTFFRRHDSPCILSTLPYVPGTKLLLLLGMVIPPLIGNPYSGQKKNMSLLFGFSDHPLPEGKGTNGSLDPSRHPLPETNIAPENWWVEDEFPFGMAHFQWQC